MARSIQVIRDAELSVAEAVGLEQENSVDHWGKKTESYQGRARVWLETARRRARSDLFNLSPAPTAPLR